ncbi:unnamed protein product [Symbiodinium natans]|uniref:Pentatricopeptide repeat-containing protein, chloroplastic n=1 Tax=Symbiodinium natans TaxID=878477 RepID=A0A812LBG2_9DINO|nr:unnamed protein product [Symbiodinium natans]
MQPPAGLRQLTSSISAANRQSLWPRAWAIWIQCQGLELDAFALSAAAATCDRGRLWKDAVVLLEQAAHGNVFVDVVLRNAAVGAGAKCAQWQSVLRLIGFQAGDEQRPTTISFNSAADACSKGSRWESSFSVTEVLLHRRLRASSTTAGTLVAAAERGSQWQKALSLIQDVPHLQVNIVAFNAAIAAMERVCQWQRAVLLLWQSAREGLVPTLHTMNTALSACARAGKWQLSLTLVDMASSLGIQVDTISWNSVLSACAWTRQWEMCLACLNRMELKKLAADCISFAAIVDSLPCSEHAGQSHLASELLSLMQEQAVESDAVLATASLSGQAKAERWQHACHTLRESLAAAFAPDKVMLGAAADACGRSGLWQKALVLIGEAAMNLPIANSVLNGFTKDASWKQAVCFFADLIQVSLQPDLLSVSALLAARGPWAASLYQVDTLGITDRADEIFYEALLTAIFSHGALAAALPALQRLRVEALRQWRRP